MKSHLKVKVHSLSSEMSYIRHQEDKWKNRARHARAKQKEQITAEEKAKAEASLSYAESNFWSQRWHREHLKHDARNSHLAYGFMKGRSYEQMENICYGDVKGHKTLPPHWARIEEIVSKFSEDEPNVRDIMQKFGEWLAAAKIWYDGNPDRIVQADNEREQDAEARKADASYQKLKVTAASEAEAFGRAAYDEGWRKVNGRWRNPQAKTEAVAAS